VKTEPIQTDEGFIGSDIFLTENQSKLYTLIIIIIIIIIISC